MNRRRGEENLRSLLIPILYAILVLQPICVWLYLVTYNIGIIVSVQWVTLILAVEISKLSGRRFRKDLATIVFLISSLAYSSPLLWLNLLYAIYYRNSPIVKMFGIYNAIPPFYAPLDPSTWLMREFFSWSWLLPILVFLCSQALSISANISLGLIAWRLYGEIEILPFPLQKPIADGIVALIERGTEKSKIFALSALISTGYATLLYGIPFIAQIFGYTVEIIPIPWIDLNKYIHHAFPGASFGVGTDIVLLAAGFMLPLRVTLSMLAGSMALFFFGNWFLVSRGLGTFAEQWVPGMSISMSWQRSILFNWMSPLIGIMIAIGLAPLILRPKQFLGILRVKSLKGTSKVLKLLMIYVASAFGSVVLTYILAPDLPIWVSVLLSVPWSLLVGIGITRVIGLTGLMVSVPYIKEITLSAINYTGHRGWFAPLYVLGPTCPPAEWCTWFKVCDLTGASKWNLIKTWLIFFPVSLIYAFVVIARFWKIAPIPSAMYPGVSIFWPVQASFQSMWISRTFKLFHPELALYSFLTVTGLYAVFELLHIPIPVAALAGGCMVPVPYAFTMMVGSIVGKVLERIFSAKFWRENRATVVAGITLGEGLVIMVAAGMVMIAKAASLIPY
ncbi:MAG: hypothetical protein DRN91_00320 [Candidatus Alkanophagales archaeon]|nr:MAG: hypothetical protein DRN91_00320 [Candidatus Alkanophagales archaeon]